MTIFEIFLIAIGLAMDAFAVSIANGVTIRDVKLSHAIKFGLYFGVFQFAMTIIGWLIGMTFADYINAIDHWVAFILLTVIGFNMIFEEINKVNKKDYNIQSDITFLKWNKMTMLAVATSIDALAVGVSFAVIYTNIILSAIIIGLIALIMSFVGVLIGNKLGKLLKKGAVIIGGIILIVIGIKILIEHIFL